MKEPLRKLQRTAAERKEYDQPFERMEGAMFRQRLTLLVMMLGWFICTGAAEESKWQDGAWDLRLVLKPANKSVYVTTAIGPVSCAAVMTSEVIKNVAAAHGYVWTDKDVTLFSYEKSEFVDIKQEVVGMNCSLVQK